MDRPGQPVGYWLKTEPGHLRVANKYPLTNSLDNTTKQQNKHITSRGERFMEGREAGYDWGSN
jgi:hypothetical protein